MFSIAMIQMFSRQSKACVIANILNLHVSVLLILSVKQDYHIFQDISEDLSFSSTFCLSALSITYVVGETKCYISQRSENKCICFQHEVHAMIWCVYIYFKY